MMAGNRTIAESSQPKQLDDLCFNTLGYAFEHPRTLPGGSVVINAKGPLSKPYTKVKRESTPSIRLSAEEVESVTPEGARKFLVIGWIPATVNKEVHGELPEYQRKQQPVGTSRPPETDILRYDPANADTFPLLAATPLQMQESDGVKLYALVNSDPNDPVRAAHTCTQIEVFYLAEYRDNTTAKGKRGPAWNQLVMKNIEGILGQEARATTKFRHAKDQAKLVLNANWGLANEVTTLAAGYATGGDIWCLEQLVAVLEAADSDLRMKPLQHPNLRLFVELEQDFGMDCAEAMVQEVGERWPEIEGVTASRLLRLRQGFCREGCFLEYRLLRGIIAEGVQQVDSWTDQELYTSATSLHETVRRIVPPVESTPLIPTTNPQRALLMGLLNKIKEIRVAGRDFDEQLKGVCGDVGVGNVTIQDIWARYADSIDTDSARQAYMQACRWFAAQLLAKNAGVMGMLDELVHTTSSMNLEK